MKKIIPLLPIIAIALVLTGCAKQTTNEVADTVMEVNTTQNEDTNSTTDTACSWIDESDVVIQLALPEEYAQYDDDTVFPSYETGFMFKSSYGDISSNTVLARKNCNYRVGFSEEDFANMNINPNYPLVVFAHKDSTSDFSYDNEPLKITLKNDLPEQGSEFILAVNGTVQSFGHYDALFQ